MDHSDSDPDQHSGAGSARSRSPVEVRLRRAHKKSRKGCKACKEQRKKCDEKKPRCGRCNRLDQPCLYPEARTRTPSPLPGPSSSQSNSPTPSFITSPPGNLTLEVPETRYRSRSFGAMPSPRSEPLSSMGDLRSPLSYAASPTLTSTPTQAPMLGPSDLELLGHFLAHTSHQRVTETVSHYAWRVGIPNLAFRSPPLMHTVLSLAALCLCFDSGCSSNFYPGHFSPTASLDPTLQSPQFLPSYDQVDRIARRLDEALSHHSAAVTGTIDGISDGRVVGEPDAALINAYLMTIYSLTSYRVQRWVHDARTALGIDATASEVPAMLSWIGLVRAAGTAVVGLMRSRLGAVSPAQSPYESPVLLQGVGIDVDTYAEAQDEATSLILPLNVHSFFPLFSSTAPAALEALTRRVDAALRMHLSTASTTACIAALSNLTRVRTAVLCSPEAPCAECIGATVGSQAAGPPGLDGIPEWIRGCILPREESGTPHRGMARIVIGWVSRLAQEFVDLLTSAVEPALASEGFGLEAAREWTVEQRLAVDIFGHWLVFTMLLSEVWWVGSLGREELKRVVEVWERRSGYGALDGEWWPREMLRAVEGLGI